jgi:hypothetical protein
LIFYPEIDDHGVRQGNTGQVIAQWRRPVASKVALDMLRWAMHSSLHRRIIMAVKWPMTEAHLFIVTAYFV